MNNGIIKSITNKDISLASKKAFVPEPEPEDLPETEADNGTN